MENNTPITLNDLKDTGTNVEIPVSVNVPEQNDIRPIQPVDISDIRPATVTVDPLEAKMANVFSDVDKAIARRTEELDKKKEEIIEEIIEKEESIDSPATDSFDTSLNKGSIFSIDEDDYDDEDEDEDQKNKDSEKQLDEVKSLIKERIKPVSNVIDLASFSISKKPVSLLNSLKTKSSNKRTVNWALPATGIPISMDSFSGLDIQKLDPNSSSKNRFNTYKEIYSILYDHIVDTNKPKTMEEWIKLVNFFDINHIYFTAYKASFDGSNSIPYSCPACKEIFMQDTAIDNMVKYKDDATKEAFKQIFEKETSDTNKYDVELIQISDDYVFGLREPSIYNVIFENVILDEKFTEKYSELLSLLTYVDCIYYINREENDLQPIELENYPNNATKTIKTKVRKYAQILETLTSDQFYVFNSYIKAINIRHDEIVYVLPECSCPKCKTVIPEQEMNGESILFTRHQLVAIANT